MNRSQDSEFVMHSYVTRQHLRRAVSFIAFLIFFLRMVLVGNLQFHFEEMVFGGVSFLILTFVEIFFWSSRRFFFKVLDCFRECILSASICAWNRNWFPLFNGKMKMSSDKFESSIVRIQSVGRGYIVRSGGCFVLTSDGVSDRDVLLRSMVVSRRRTSGIIMFQSLFRMIVVRRLFLLKRSAVKLLQKKYRSFHVAREAFAVLRIQSFLRSFFTLQQYSSIRKSAVVLQRSYRGYSARICALLCAKVVIKLQSLVRKFLAQVHFSRQKSAAIVLGKWMRFYRMRGRKIQTRYLEILSRKQQILTTVRIQSLWRRYFALSDYIRIRRGVIVIQALARTFLWKKNMTVRCCAARTIQYAWNAVRNKLADDSLRLSADEERRILWRAHVLAEEEVNRIFDLSKSILSNPLANIDDVVGDLSTFELQAVADAEAEVLEVFSDNLYCQKKMDSLFLGDIQIEDIDWLYEEPDSSLEDDYLLRQNLKIVVSNDLDRSTEGFEVS